MTPPSESTKYQIVILGHLDEGWSPVLGGAVIEHRGAPDFPLTVLRGEFKDQAALLGILNTLYDLKLALVSYTCDHAFKHFRSHIEVQNTDLRVS